MGFGWLRMPADRAVFARARAASVFGRARGLRGHGPFARVAPPAAAAHPQVLEPVGATESAPAAAEPAMETGLVPLEPAREVAPTGFVASDEERARVSQILEEARSASTRRAYSSDWSRFLAWCKGRGAEPLPAAPEVVVVYLGELLDQQKSTATIERALASISMAHAAGGHDRPRRAELVRQFMRGLRRHTRDKPRRRARALSLDELKRLVDATPATAAGVRDRAMLLLGFFGAFRRSELADLDKADIEETTEGLVVRLRWSKTDQEGEGHVVGIPVQQDARYCPMGAVKEWLEQRGDDERALFVALDRRCDGQRLKPQAVERILEAAAKRAGLEGRFTPHSLRAGFATAAARAGAAERAIMKQTRHRSVAVLHGYIRDAEVFVGSSARLT